jgi:hypothetical protein
MLAGLGLNSNERSARRGLLDQYLRPTTIRPQIGVLDTAGNLRNARDIRNRHDGAAKSAAGHASAALFADRFIEKLG